MKKQIALLLAAVMLAAGVTGCGIVKVVKIGQEGALTGETEFDSSQQSGQDWEHVVAEITENAKDLKEVEGDIGTDAVAVSGTAVDTRMRFRSRQGLSIREPRFATCRH